MFSDLTLEFGDDYEFKAHECVLRPQSPWLAKKIAELKGVSHIFSQSPLISKFTNEFS
jgi:hypothetical protein